MIVPTPDQDELFVDLLGQNAPFIGGDVRGVPDPPDEVIVNPRPVGFGRGTHHIPVFIERRAWR